MYQISPILDGVDGEIARASMKTSRFGGYVDSVLDRYVDFAFLLALAYVMIRALVDNSDNSNLRLRNGDQQSAIRQRMGAIRIFLQCIVSLGKETKGYS